MHIKKKCQDGNKWLVNDKVLKESHEVKNLGDVIHEDGQPRTTILTTLIRGWAICGQIFVFLKDIPIGNIRVQILLELENHGSLIKFFLIMKFGITWRTVILQVLSL